MSMAIADTLALQRLVLDFAHRDRGNWDALQALFLPGAPIHVSWYSGPIEGFVAASRAMAERGAPPARHLIGPPRIDVAGGHAAGETDVIIMVRLPTPAGELDVTSWARFYDLFTRHEGSWRIAERQAVYEKDRVDPVGPATLGDDWSQAALSAHPPAFKHLSKLLSRVGQSIVTGTVATGDAAEAAIFARAEAWLQEG